MRHIITTHCELVDLLKQNLDEFLRKSDAEASYGPNGYNDPLESDGYGLRLYREDESIIWIRDIFIREDLRGQGAFSELINYAKSKREITALGVSNVKNECLRQFLVCNGFDGDADDTHFVYKRRSSIADQLACFLRRLSFMCIIRRLSSIRRIHR